MNILLIGSGGREHALAWKMRQSPLCKKLFITPGNAGTSLLGENVALAVDEFEKLGALCLEKKIDLVVVGPEVPLVKGIRDYFMADERLKNILMVGPDKTGAQLEGSKDFSKQFMLRHHIPTAQAKTFFSNQSKEACHYLQTLRPPYVLKADGLAAGKGVVISSSLDEAQTSIKEMLEEKKFGEASAKVLIEEFLDGIELSVFVLTDGKDYVILPEAKDYKRIGDNDTGPNTGGMGSVSPVPFADKAFMKVVEEKIVKPTVDGLKKENINYKGFIFIGLMAVKGEPYVIEYNARMGDPETQSVMVRIQSDFVELLRACAKGELKNHSIEVDPSFAATVVMAAGGYPDSYEKGKVISGLDEVTTAQVFHAGTKQEGGQVITDGGRVLAVTAKGNTLLEAQQKAYQTVHSITWNNVYFRGDIGNDLLQFKA
ncbi:MAG: phosphoribosylamine--glycine ligase [Bacteroidetes bacterium]|nr:phosphoribosylamine--glycine ligase [Bacteroidota bacterium]MBS1540009.1 phosphoribosylamine--glycine ligase [Bacteroidota bacterium]